MIETRVYFSLACLCALSVANIYYNQPLLELFSREFSADAKTVGSIAMVVQLSYAAGLVFFVPLGDRVVRRRLLGILLGINAVASLFAAMAQDIAQLLISNVAIGMTAVGAQIIIPMATLLAPQEQRGRAVGIVMSGLMAGVLFARILSGTIGEHWGWRVMYIVAAAINVIMIVIIYRLLPHNCPSKNPMPYRQLIVSLLAYFRQESELRKACLSGALMFGSFSALWGALALLLSRPPYHFGSDIVGAFGFAGIAGILMTPIIGNLADRYTPQAIVILGSLCAIVGFLLLAMSGHYLTALIISVIFLDVGGRAGLVGNQLRALALSETARNRLNTVFMFCYFLGGALGTRIGAELSLRFGWFGIALLGVITSLIVIFFNFKGMLSLFRRPSPPSL
ncbi:MFS transporter [Serratia fonticola]|nr:MFS transporter [Serratia fonticola]